MAVDPLAELPDVHPAGLTLAWTHALDSEYAPGGDYTLTTYFRGPSKLDVAAVGSAGVWTSTVTAAQSGQLTAGTYQWETHAIGGGGTTRYVVQSGTLTITPSLVSAAAGALVSHAAQALPLLEEQYRALAATKLESYTIEQRAGHYRKLSELRAEIGAMRREIARERNGGKVPGVTFAFGRVS